MIVADASVLIAHLAERDALYDRAEEALMRTAEQRLCSSTLTLAEVVVRPARRDRLTAAGAVLAELQVEELQFGNDAASRRCAPRPD